MRSRSITGQAIGFGHGVTRRRKISTVVDQSGMARRGRGPSRGEVPWFLHRVLEPAKAGETEIGTHLAD
jgi:hypothetical protein